jgi:xanthine/CO dehydrogenase XdhC/CoxF family maturation factor
MSDDRSDPLDSAAALDESSQKVALATVTRTWARRLPRGSQMAVREDGAFAGSVSGVCGRLGDRPSSSRAERRQNPQSELRRQQ